jgi:hypothetical protein
MTYSCTQKTSKHIDHVCCYIGLNNNSNNTDDSLFKNINSNNNNNTTTKSTLYGLNELAQKNRLILCRRQVSNRDIRILIPNSSASANSLNTNDSNYKKFLYNFNVLSYACYLTALNANENLWKKHDIPQQLAKDTSFFVIGSSPTINEKCMKVTLEDEEFVNNYTNVMFNLHNKVSNDLYRVLNTNLPQNEEFIDKNNDNSKGDIHLFRTFRIIGLRHPIKDNYKVGNLNEIVEIRVSFDIRQSASKSTYDCFIECELSYYKIAPITKKLSSSSSSLITSDSTKWFNILSNDLKKRNRIQNYSISSSQSSLELT